MKACTGIAATEEWVRLKAEEKRLKRKRKEAIRPSLDAA